MEKSEWQEIDPFVSESEYRRFLFWLDQRLACGDAIDVTEGEVDQWSDRTICHVATKEIWKLLAPDPGYFPGAWILDNKNC